MKEYFYKENKVLTKRSITLSLILTYVVGLLEYSKKDMSYLDSYYTYYDFIFLSKYGWDLGILFLADVLLFFSFVFLISRITEYILNLGSIIELGGDNYINNRIKNISILIYILSLPFSFLILLILHITFKNLVNKTKNLVSGGIPFDSGLIPLFILILILSLILYFIIIDILNKKTPRQEESKDTENKAKEGKQSASPTKIIVWLLIVVIIGISTGLVVGQDIVGPQEDRDKIYGVFIGKGNSSSCTLEIFEMGEAEKIIIGNKTVKEEGVVQANDGDKIIIENEYARGGLKQHYALYQEDIIDLENSEVDC